MTKNQKPKTAEEWANDVFMHADEPSWSTVYGVIVDAMAQARRDALEPCALCKCIMHPSNYAQGRYCTNPECATCKARTILDNESTEND